MLNRQIFLRALPFKKSYFVANLSSIATVLQEKCAGDTVQIKVISFKINPKSVIHPKKFIRDG